MKSNALPLRCSKGENAATEDSTELSGEPCAWSLKTLEGANVQIIDGDRGKAYPSEEDFQQNGHCLFLNAKNVTKIGFNFDNCAFVSVDKDKQLGKGKLQRNDLVLTTRGTIGNVAWYHETIPFDHVRINSGMAIIRTANSKIDANFLYQLFKSRFIISQIERVSFGSAQPQLTIGLIQKLKIPCPPLEEQRKIAEILSYWDFGINTIISLLELNSKLKAGLFQKLFTSKYGNEFFNYRSSRLGNIVELVNGRAYQQAELLEEGTPVLRIQNLKGGSSWYYSNLTLPEKNYCEAGDLLFAWSASFGPFIWKGSRSIFHYHIWKVLVGNEHDVEYVYYLLDSITAEIKARSHGGLGMLHMTKEGMENWLVQVPDLKGQQLIKTIMKSVDAERTALTNLHESFQKQKNALMQKLLTGKIRVKV